MLACMQVLQAWRGSSTSVPSEARPTLDGPTAMEAATPLRTASVRTIGDRLAIDGLVVADDAAVRLVRQREEAGEDPLSDFRAGTIAALKRAAESQDANMRAVNERMAGLQQELQALRDEKQKAAELEAERERGSAKGRSFEEAVAEAIDAIAALQ